MDENFQDPVNQPLVGDVCDVGFGAVLKKVNGTMVQALALNLDNETTRLLEVLLCSGAGFELQKFK